MTGDQSDMGSRLRLALPGRWFGDVAPVLDGVLAGLGALWAQLYSLIGIVKIESRIRTADGNFLDMACTDFFGATFARRVGETDGDFRLRLLWAMQRGRVTRAALEDIALHSGYRVSVFEPAQPQDTGAYNVASSLAWGQAGGWGSLEMPLETLIVAAAEADAQPSELLAALAAATPAGGAAWVKLI